MRTVRAVGQMSGLRLGHSPCKQALPYFGGGRGGGATFSCATYALTQNYLPYDIYHTPLLWSAPPESTDNDRGVHLGCRAVHRHANSCKVSSSTEIDGQKNSCRTPPKADKLVRQARTHHRQNPPLKTYFRIRERPTWHTARLEVFCISCPGDDGSITRSKS